MLYDEFVEQHPDELIIIVKRAGEYVLQTQQVITVPHIKIEVEYDDDDNMIVTRVIDEKEKEEEEEILEVLDEAYDDDEVPSFDE